MIVVTGAAGYLGSALHPLFSQNKMDWVGIDKIDFADKPNQRIILGDYSHSKDLINLIESSLSGVTLVHLAATNDVRRSIENSLEYVQANYVRPLMFMRKYASKISRVVYTSICSVNLLNTWAQ